MYFTISDFYFLRFRHEGGGRSSFPNGGPVLTERRATYPPIPGTFLPLRCVVRVFCVGVWVIKYFLVYGHTYRSSLFGCRKRAPLLFVEVCFWGTDKDSIDLGLSLVLSALLCRWGLINFIARMKIF